VRQVRWVRWVRWVRLVRRVRRVRMRGLGCVVRIRRMRAVRGELEARRAVERQVNQPPHVGGRQERRDDAHDPQPRVAAIERLEQNLVLREEPGQRRDARDGDRPDDECPVGNRQVLLEAAHVADVLLTVQRVNHRAGSEKEQRLEERVGIEVEDAGAERPDAHRQEHVPELRDGRIREHALDVVLDQPDSAGKERRRRTDDGDNPHGDRRVHEQFGRASDHVDTGRHHRRRMDEGGDRRRAFHGIRQPDVQRDLGRLARGADEEQQRDERQHPEGGFGGHGRNRGGNLIEVEGAERDEQQQRPEDERVIADPVDDERLVGSVRSGLPDVVITDEQIRAEPDAFPPDEHHQDVRAEHEQQHEEDEQVQIREVARELAVGLLVHVRGRIDVDERPNPGDDQDHHRRQRIEAEGRVDHEVAGRDPGEQRLLDLAGARVHPDQAHDLESRDDKRAEHHGAGETARHALGQPASEERVDQEAEEREERYQRQHAVTTSTRRRLQG
jgi:hypothetical protein